MDPKLVTGIIGAGSAIIGALSQAMVSSIINSGIALRNERIRVIIDIEEYLDELWRLSESLCSLRENEISSSDDNERKTISASFNRHLDRFYSIWDSRKRAIELNWYFKDKDIFRTFRKIERLYEKSKNKIEMLSPYNDKLLSDLLDIDDEIYTLRSDLSEKLQLHLSWLYILLPTYLRLFHKLKNWVKRPRTSSTVTSESDANACDVKHGRKKKDAR